MIDVNFLLINPKTKIVFEGFLVEEIELGQLIQKSVLFIYYFHVAGNDKCMSFV